MSGEYLFYIGIVVPTVITVILFAVFLWCLYRYKSRRKVLTEIYAPHSKGWPDLRDVSPPCSTTYYREPLIYDAPPPTTLSSRMDPRELDASLELRQSNFAARHHQDSGIAADFSHEPRRGNNDDDARINSNKIASKQRPYSQASTDSDDSGFRSSRSAHYLQKHENLQHRKRDGTAQTMNRQCEENHHTMPDDIEQTACDSQRTCQRGYRRWSGHERKRKTPESALQTPRDVQLDGFDRRRMNQDCRTLRCQTDTPAAQIYGDDKRVQPQTYIDAPLLQGLNDCHKNQCSPTNALPEYPWNTAEFLPQFHSTVPYRQQTDVSVPYSPHSHCGDLSQSTFGHQCDSIGLREFPSVHDSTVLTFTAACVHGQDAPNQPHLPIFSVV